MKAIWDWLDGKKAHIAHAYWAIVVPSAVIIWPQGTPENVGKAIAIIGLALTAFGYGHKAVKARGAKNVTPRL